MPFHRGRAPRVVPWATRAEWNAVYEMLYATESSGDRVDRADMDSRQRQGIAMVLKSHPGIIRIAVIDIILRDMPSVPHN